MVYLDDDGVTDLDDDDAYFELVDRICERAALDQLFAELTR